MRSNTLRHGSLLAVALLAAACNNDTTAPSTPLAQTDGVSARGGSSSGGGGGGKSTGLMYTGVVDSTVILNVGVYYPSYRDVWYSGSHAFSANTTTKIHSSSDTPLVAGACAQFTYNLGGTIEYVSDIKVLTADKCAI